MTILVHEQAEESDEKLIISKGKEEHDCGAATFILPSNSSTSDDNLKERSSFCKGVYDASGEMKQLCEAMALKDVLKSSIAIANEVAETTRTKYKQLGEKIDIFVFAVFTSI